MKTPATKNATDFLVYSIVDVEVSVGIGTACQHKHRRSTSDVRFLLDWIQPDRSGSGVVREHITFDNNKLVRSPASQ